MNSPNHATVLVTGATGRLGREVGDLLAGEASQYVRRRAPHHRSTREQA